MYRSTISWELFTVGKAKNMVGYIFVHDTLTYTNIDLSRYCNELDLEACAIKMRISDIVFCTLCIYRSPTSNFLNFLCLLESILMQLYSNTTNVNYLW